MLKTLLPEYVWVCEYKAPICSYYGWCSSHCTVVHCIHNDACMAIRIPDFKVNKLWRDICRLIRVSIAFLHQFLFNKSGCNIHNIYSISAKPWNLCNKILKKECLITQSTNSHHSSVLSNVKWIIILWSFLFIKSVSFIFQFKHFQKLKLNGGW